MRRLLVTMSLFVAFLMVATATGWPGGLLDEATGSTSQTLCTKVFVSGLDAEDVFREHLRPEPGMWIIAWAMRHEIDRDRREVRASLGGLFLRRSVYAEGRGCTLEYAGYPPPTPLKPAPVVDALLPPLEPASIGAPSDAALATALDAAFADPLHQGLNTKAVVILHDGHLIAERYAPGYGPGTRLLAHSITKSVVNALAAVLVRDGRLSMEEPAPVPSWQGVNDPRRHITVGQLMRMNAGFGFDEGGGSSAATQIWFRHPDTAAAAADARLLSSPGRRWGYSSRSYALLARIVQDRVGGSPQAMRDFALKEVFGPLGIKSFTPEFDASGTMMGGQASLATPRDWARFGQLYLDDGVVAGHRILPEGWVRWSTTPTPGTGYGAGFWLNTTSDVIGEWGFRWGLPGAPKDAFMARGYMGQYIIIVPSARLVVVRFGQSHGKGAGVESAGALVKSVIAAIAAR